MGRGDAGESCGGERAVKIGTLSFEVYGDCLDFCLPSEERISIIINIARDQQPDLLVGAGFTVDNDGDVAALARQLSELGGRTEIVVEARDSEQSPIHLRDFDVEQQRKRRPDREPSPRTHGVFLIKPNDQQLPLGPQWFGQATELGGSEGRWRIENFSANLAGKSQDSIHGRILAICCGEIGLLTAPKSKGRPSDVRLKIAEAANAVDAADIIVNPTHDMMGYPGLLDNKRQWFSRRRRSGSSRVYISASNWNSQKRGQRADSKYLHTCYVSGYKWGEMKSFDRPCVPNERFEYREWSIVRD